MAKESKSTSTSLTKWQDYDVEDAEQDAEELKNSKSNKSLAKLKEGKNRVRFVPALPGRNWKRVTYEHWIDVPGLGTVRFTCPLFEAKQKCRACDTEKRLMASSKESDQTRGKRFKAQRKAYTNVVFRENEAAGVVTLPIGVSIENQLVEMRKDEDLGGNFIHPVQGFDIIIVKSGSGLETRYAVHPADKGRSSELCEDAKQMNEWIAGQPDLEKFVKVYSDSDIERLLNGEKPEAWGPGGGKKGKSVADEIDDDETDDEDD